MFLIFLPCVVYGNPTYNRLSFYFGVSPKKHIWQKIIYLIGPQLNVFLLVLINRRDLIGYEVERLAGVRVVYCCCIIT